MIIIKHDQDGHQFVTDVEGSRAHLDYTLADGVMTITHTKVPSPIGGRGIAGELMAAALSAARAAGWTVIPACSYARSYMAKHPDRQHMDALLDEALDESFPASDSPSVGGTS